MGWLFEWGLAPNAAVIGAITGSVSPEVLVHQVLGALFLPPLLFFWLAVLAWLARSGGSVWLSRLLLWLAFVGIYLFSTPQMAMWLSDPLEPTHTIYPNELASVDAIVVLGGGKRPSPEYGSENLSLDSFSRLRYGAWLARLSGAPILVSGGAPLGGESEADIMQRVLKSEFGLTARWVENRSNTTLENATRSAPLLRSAGIKRIALVSQAWHLRRAEGFFREQGLIVIPAATGFIRYEGPAWLRWLPQGRAMQECHSAFREDIGLVYYDLRNLLLKAMK
jgi:uncharacterized SAM-binding protein YcdF (DUF218 family)